MRLRYIGVFIVLIGLISFAEPGKCFAEVREIKRDIQLLNLINGLELTQAQMRLIIQKAERAEKIRNEQEREFVQTLEKLRENLKQGKEVSPLLRKQVRRSRRTMERQIEDYKEKITEFTVRVERKLYKHQLYTLENHRACLIVPEGSAAGQVEGSKGIERLLSRARNMPAPAFEERKEELVQRIIKRIRRALPRGFIIEEGERRRILAILEDARYLTDVDFALNKTELAQELKPKHALPQRSISLSVKIKRFLLAAEIIPLLKEKLIN